MTDHETPGMEHRNDVTPIPVPHRCQGRTSTDKPAIAAAGRSGRVARYIHSDDVRAGVVAITPMVVGVIPFGLAAGSAAGAADIPTPAALGTAPAIFAGAAQLTTNEMLDAGVAPLVIIASALMINARLLLYSAAMAPWFRGERLTRRLILALPVIDQMHFTCVPRFEQGDLDRSGRLAFYAGAGTFLLSAWLAANTLAVLIGPRLPEVAGLQVAAPIVLAGLLAKSPGDRRTSVAVGVAGTLAVVAVAAPLGSSVLIAALAGIAAGSAAHRIGAQR